MVGNWQSSFGGPSVNPSDYGLVTIQLEASSALVWPLESSGSPQVSPAMIVIPSLANLSLAMPDATQGATGIISAVNNPGNVAFTLTDTYGAQICVVDVGQTWVIWLIDNGTPAGQWTAFMLGATSSNAQSGQLAGAGLQAVGAALQSYIGTVKLNADTGLDATYRAKGVIWYGAAGDLQLADRATLTAGWWVMATNVGTGAVTVSTTGTDTIDGQATITIPVGEDGAPYSTMIVAAGDGFYTFGGVPPIIPISGGGTGASTAGQALINFGGSTIGIEIFEAPTAAAILALLGIGPSAFTEQTIGGNQTLTESDLSNAYVCTAALTLLLPDSTTVTNQFLFAAYAEGGAVTLTPGSGADAINGGTAGANFVMPQGTSALWITDGNKNWWPLFFYTPNWGQAAGTADAITVAFSPPNRVLTDGLLISVRASLANTTTDPTLLVDGHGPFPIVKDSLGPIAPNDIPGANYEMQLRYNLAHTSWVLMNPATAWLDNYSTTQGAVLFRGADYWQALPPGTQGQVLNSGYLPSGVSPVYVNPAWATPNTPQMHAQLFGATGNFTVPAGATTATVFKFKVIGGGGGGGCGAGGSGNGGGGGGGGGYGEVLVSGFTAGDIITATIGTGGGGASTTASNGATGNTSKVTRSGVDFITSLGGVGGTSGSGSSQPGGAAGTVTVNTAGAGLSLNGTIASAVSQAGNAGGYSSSSVASGGSGGSTPYGFGGGTTVTIGATNTNGQNGSGYGSGGAGGADSGTGGNGSNGAVIVEWVL